MEIWPLEIRIELQSKDTVQFSDIVIFFFFFFFFSLEKEINPDSIWQDLNLGILKRQSDVLTIDLAIGDKDRTTI